MATRFRAYQLGGEGSSFSYCHNGHFILIEARITESNAENVAREIRDHGNGQLDTLHITSWDQDHCAPGELEQILKYLKPKRIEYPGYPPHTDTAKESAKLISSYSRAGGNAVDWSPTRIDGLSYAEPLKARDVILWPREIGSNSNNNSTAKFFRRGHFTVLSLGDLEDEAIAERIAAGSIVTGEVDVMILAHHGADNGFTSEGFLRSIQPRVAICTSNYDNQYDHPRQEIRDLLYDNDIRLFTTKTGDVLIKSIGDDNRNYRVVNFKAGNEDISSVVDFAAKTWFENAA